MAESHNAVRQSVSNRITDPVIHLGVVFAIVFANFLLSTPATVMLDDDGYFILSAYFNGVAHEPGYPLYTAIAYVATLLPFETVAWRVHALSGLFGAAACACLWMLAYRFLEEKIYAYVVAFCFAFSSVFWSQSIVAEVYTLNVLLFFVLLLLCVLHARGVAAGGKDHRPAWTAFIYGLSLTNHWPLMAVSTPSLIAVSWTRLGSLLRQSPRLLPIMIVGLTPYLWMVFRSRYSEISFNGPIETWADFWHYLSRREYADIEQSATAGLADKLKYCGFALAETARQFGPFGAFLVLFGFVAQWRRLRRDFAWGLTLAYLGSTFFLAGLLSFDYDALSRNVFRAYPVPAYGAASLWLGIGAEGVVVQARKWIAGRVGDGLLRGAVLVLFVFSTWLANAPANLRTSDRWADQYARVSLEALEKDASFIVYGDYVTGPIAYLNKIEGLRSDVTLLHLGGKLFSNRLFHPNTATPEEVISAFRAYMAASETPVYYFPFLPLDLATDFYGLYYSITSNNAPAPDRVVLSPAIFQYFEDIFSRGEPRDPSQRIHYRYLLDGYCAVLSTLSPAASQRSAEPDPAQLLETRCSNYYGFIRQADMMLAAEQPAPHRILQILERARGRTGEVIRRSDAATLDYLFGRAYLLAGNEGKARKHFAASLAARPNLDNPAHSFMKQSVKEALNKSAQDL